MYGVVMLTVELPTPSATQSWRTLHLELGIDRGQRCAEVERTRAVAPGAVAVTTVRMLDTVMFRGSSVIHLLPMDVPLAIFVQVPAPPADGGDSCASTCHARMASPSL